jgi:predicted RNA binding protein YcfA (HicA-like mRNA interferase family)
VLPLKDKRFDMPTTGKNMVREMQKDGWKLDRIAGSHYIMERKGETVAVPVHGNKDLIIGTEANIRKMTGLYKKNRGRK